MRIVKLATRWWRSRPRTKFEAWDRAQRAALAAEAREIGTLPEGALPAVTDLLWQSLKKHPPGAPGQGAKKKARRRGRRRGKHEGKKLAIPTPYGPAWAWLTGSGRHKPLILGLHGGGEGAGSADEARGNWQAKDVIGIYPQAIRLVHDTWNTVHGERLALTLIEIAKVELEIDPDRVYSMGFSMGGSGTWFLAGRHPDLLAGASPCAGVLMADPKSQLPTKEEVKAIQHGLVPNVRNLAMYYYIGLEDRNCMPGTFLYAWDMLRQLRQQDPTGYANIHFQAHEGLGHAFPPGEPRKGIQFLLKQRRDTFPQTLVWEYAAAPYPLREASDPVDRLCKRFFYWLACADPRDGQHIRATRESNEITLELSRGAAAKGLTVLLNDAMIDPSKEVVIRVGGVEQYRGKPVPDFWTVLETLDARLDRSLVFDRRVVLR